MVQNTTTISGTVPDEDADSITETSIAQGEARAILTDYVVRGMGFSADHGAETVDIGNTNTRGNFAVIQTSGNLAYKIFPDQATGLAFATTSGVNYVYVAYDPSADEIKYHIDDDDTPPSDPSLKIGEIDAGADTETELNRGWSPPTDSVGSDAIAAGAVDTSELAAGAVGTTELQGDAVTSAKIADGTVAQADLAAGAVGIAELADEVDDDYYRPSETGVVAAGDADIIWVGELPDTETLTVEQAAAVTPTGALSNGVDLRIITDPFGTPTSQTVLIAGDGSTVHNDEVDPGSYTNSSGGAEVVAIVIDNGNFGSGAGADESVIVSTHHTIA